MNTWVTSVVDEKEAEKALFLAASLRRLHTGKKLAVFVIPTISEKALEKLQKAFHLVLFLKQSAPNHLSLEEYAKVHAFTLTAFEKVVYLSPNTVALRNCDEIFEKYGNEKNSLAALQTKDGNSVDTSVLLFTPSIDISYALKQVLLAHKETGKNGFGSNFLLWLKNNRINFQLLEENFNTGITASRQELEEASIINFGKSSLHPLDSSEKITAFPDNLGQGETTQEDMRQEPIAVVGLSFRLPGANSEEEFWELLINGREAIVPVPDHRWTKDRSVGPCYDRKMEAGFLSVPIDEFDAKFFGYSPKEAEFLDPQQRLLHEVAWEALESALIDPLSLKGSKAGIFTGSWIFDYKDICSRVTDEFFRVYMGASVASSSARLSHFLQTVGPSIATESGCSSSFVAMDLACKSLRRGESSVALACGANLMLHPVESKKFSFAVAPDGRCKTFDASADGFGRAEGCAAIVLKRVSDAVREGDKIWGLIRGSAITQEGLSKSYGTPTIHSESMAMELALKDAGVDPDQIRYVETHGTGTAVGDPLEFAAITKAYRSNNGRRREPLAIGSVKTNVGHTESVSGLTGIIKVLLSIKNEQIPPHRNLTELNPAINLDAIPAEIPMKPLAWPMEPGTKRIAGVSSFGISGTDGHCIIEEAPSPITDTALMINSFMESNQEQQLDRPLHLLKISAKSPESMEQLLQKYQEICEKQIELEGATSFANFAHSANIGRASFNHRAILQAKDFAEAGKLLKDKQFLQGDIQSTGNQPLCFLFTGQGSQYPGMSLGLYETSPIFQEAFDECAKVLERRYNIDLKRILWGQDKSSEELSRTLYSQTSIFCVEYCLLQLWTSWGIIPDYVLGHSLGEFAAAVASGTLDFEGALTLVAERSRLIDALPRGKMLVLRADKETVDKKIKEFKEVYPGDFWVDYAALNSADQTVVAGDIKKIAAFNEFCSEAAIKTIVLAATHAFHSRHMEPMLKEYGTIAEHVLSSQKPKNSHNSPKYISGMEGKLVLNAEEELNANYWVRHTREKVSYTDACKILREEGISLFLEVGPHPVLSALTLMNLDGGATCLPSLRRGKEDWPILLESLSKLYVSSWKGDINWKGFDKPYNRQRTETSLPFYPFNRKPVWIPIRPQPRRMHHLLGKLLPNASGRSVFETEISLKGSCEWVQDHVIGNTVIFPGAGFMEMCLAGGHSSVQSFSEEIVLPRRPVVLKSLMVKAPLALYDSNSCILQTTVSLENSLQKDHNSEEEIGYNVNIFRLDEQCTGPQGQWIPHAVAKFIPVAPASLENPFQGEMGYLNIPKIKEEWEESSSESQTFYEKLPEVGLRFGPKFRSLEGGWKGKEDQKGLLLQVKVPKIDTDSLSQSFFIHPVVADAMIQAIMLWNSLGTPGGLKKKLQVPVQIGQFVWLPKSAETVSSERYIYCEGQGRAILVDGDGHPLAWMESVDFAETNVKLVEGMIQQQKSAMPGIWEEAWKTTPGPVQTSIELKDMPASMKEMNEEQKAIAEQLAAHSPEENAFYKGLCESTRLYFLRALVDLGWKPEVGQKIKASDLRKSLGILDNFQNYFRFFLKSWEASNSQEKGGCLSGFLERLEEEEDQENPQRDYIFKVIKLSPSKENILSLLRAQIPIETQPSLKERTEYRCILEVANKLSDVLTGKAAPLSILFPDDPKIPSAGQFYDKMRTHVTPSLKHVFEKLSLPYILDAHTKTKVKPEKAPVVRILEVGAGTGAFTRQALEGFDDNSSEEFEYWYTDVSAAFFNQAEALFKNHPKKVIFKKYNIEEDPLHQGIPPEYFDFIYACEVLHIAKDLKKVLHNLRGLLKPGGVFHVLETVVQDPRITFYFGLMDGYWNFQDYDLRPDHATLTMGKWEEVLRSVGFSEIVPNPLYDGVHGFICAFASEEKQVELQSIKISSGNGGDEKHSWIIFENEEDAKLIELLKQQLTALNRKVISISRPKESVTEEEAQKMISFVVGEAVAECRELEGVIYLWTLSSNLEDSDQTRISLPAVTLAQHVSNGTMKPPRIYALTHGVNGIEGSDVINPSPGTLVGLGRAFLNEDNTLQVFQLDLCPNSTALEQFEEIRSSLFGSSKDNVVAFRGGKRLTPRFTPAKMANDALSIPKGCDRYQLLLAPTKLISDLEFGYLEPYQLGDYEIEIQLKAMALNFRDVFTVLKPVKEFDEYNSVGLDFAGVVSKVGPKVTLRKVGDRVAGMNPSKNHSLPSHLKHQENLVVPLPNSMTFAEGATFPAVFTTVIYSLVNVAQIKKGETLLVHTASGGVGLCAIQFAKRMGVEVIATAGSNRKRQYLRNLGIRHVFDSRSTDFGKQVLEVTGRGVDVVLNSLTGEGFKEASLGALTENGRFVEMSLLNIWSREEVKNLRPDVFYDIVEVWNLKTEEFVETLNQNLTEDVIQPVPYETFDALNIRGALGYLQKARHIGKIVCLMPEVKVDEGKIICQTNLFNETSTYLVTGGLGGIGFEVVKYMLKNGAKHVAIVSRSLPKPDKAAQIQQWNKAGKHVEAFSVDIGDWNQVKELFEYLKEPETGFPPLRGVMHAAGVLHDSIIKNQSWSTFQYTFNPKIKGTWNLHELTKDLILEHFVIFSSIAAIFGSPGQTNHSASNSFEDAFAHYRRSIGLPATAVNWGNWGEVGVATEIDFPGIRPISTKEGILALDTFLKTGVSHRTVLNGENFALICKVFPLVKSFLADKQLAGGEGSGKMMLIHSDEFWGKVDTAEGREEKEAEFKNFIKSTLKTILKLGEEEEIEDHEEFSVLGIDSLMMLEMKNSLQNVLGQRLQLSTSQLKECTTTASLAEKMVQVLMDGDGLSEDVIPTMEELKELIREDSVLPEYIKPEVDAKATLEVKTVLLTGATGNFGPYLLRELSNRPEIQKIYCLIRKTGKLSPIDKLKKKLESLELLDHIALSKVECVEGDITEDKLGLSPEEYDNLGENIEGIVNGAVLANHVAKYWRCPTSRKQDNLRLVNVKGMERILAFACHKTLKQVLHCSTGIAVTTLDETCGSLTENWEDVGAFDFLTWNFGYVISKHIAEQLVKEAVNRDIPCKVFRFGVMSGESGTGRADYLRSHFMLRALTFLKLKCMPDIPAPVTMAPIDHCAKHCLSIFFNGEAPSGPYNIMGNRASGIEQDLVTIAQEQFGIEIEPVSIAEFTKKLKGQGADSPLAAFSDFYAEQEQAIFDLAFDTNRDLVANYLQHFETFFASQKMAHYLPQEYHSMQPNHVVLTRDLIYAKNTGAFEKFGISS